MGGDVGAPGNAVGKLRRRGAAGTGVCTLRVMLLVLCYVTVRHHICLHHPNINAVDPISV